LLIVFAKVERLYNKETYILKAHLTTNAYLFYFKRVYTKAYLKEFYLVKQGFYKLESEKKDFN